MTDSSTIRELLDSDVIPDFLDKTMVQETIDFLDIEISKLQATLTRRQRQRDSYLALLSPCRDVPPEVLGEIISRLVVPQLAAKHSGRQLVNLCLVSRSWREAALGTACLWATARIRKPLDKSSMSALERWIIRAGSLPKTLIIDAPPDDCPHDTIAGCSLATKSLAKFFLSGPALDNLLVNCAGSPCLARLLRIMATTQPGFTSESTTWRSIRTISFDFRRRWHEREFLPDGSPPSIFASLPPVECLALAVPSAPPSHHLTWGIHIPNSILGNLKVFSLQCNWDGSKILKLLNSCTSLRKLTLHFGERTILFSDPITPITLPRLLSLRLKGMWTSSYNSLIPNLDCPSLLELDIGFEKESPLGAHQMLDDRFATVTGSLIKPTDYVDSTLRCLQIRSVDIGPGLSAIADCSSLEVLSLDDVVVDSSSFEGIKAGGVLPNLKALLIHRLPEGCDMSVVTGYAEEINRARDEAQRKAGGALGHLSKVTVLRQRSI